MATEPASPLPGGLRGLQQRWLELTRAQRVNVALYALTALSMVGLLFELGLGDEDPAELDLASRGPTSTVRTLPSTTTSTSSTTSTSTTTTTAAPTTTVRPATTTTTAARRTPPPPQPEPPDDGPAPTDPPPPPPPPPDPPPDPTTTQPPEPPPTIVPPTTSTTFATQVSAGEVQVPLPSL